jgi:hypothetical protein
MEQLTWIGGIAFAAAAGIVSLIAYSKRHQRTVAHRLYLFSYALMTVSILLVALRAL